METRNQWAITLKNLRETGDCVILGAVQNVQTIFTHDNIIIITPNKSSFDMLTKYREKLGGNVVIRMKKTEDAELTIEQKLVQIFGDHLKIETTNDSKNNRQ